MLTGALLKLPDLLDVALLDRLIWARKSSGLDLRSVIQFDNNPIQVDQMTLQEASAIHEHIVPQAVLVEENGRFKITYNDAIAPIMCKCYFAHGLAVVTKLAHRIFVQNTINHGLRDKGVAMIIPVHDIAINTGRLWLDHQNHWIRSFDKRAGRVDRGILYGEGIEQDPVFAQEVNRANCKTVGWTTDYFGVPVKVRVTPSGSVTALSDIPMQFFFDFIQQEILPYAI
jgi:hypothetical protein